MNLTDRQNDILTRAATQGRVSVDDLASQFAVTPQTIRRDLNELCGRGLLTRTYGGARPANTISNVGYEERRELASEGKRRIAAAAARHIPDRSSLILNIGTTTEHVARALYHRRDLVVITNNLNVINILSGSPAKELIIAGGVVRQTDGGIVGEAAMEFIRNFKVDLAVIGASALDEDGAVLDFDYREVSVARAMIDCARRTVLVADHNKFERRATVRICDISQIDIFVTDAEPPPRFRQICQRHGVHLEVVGDPVDPDPLDDGELA
ncbi:MAG: DeoR/GlpR transcriptional regulator [Rhodospirillaceae bacterium]|nr:DeoR/GlpR transcriptional regulator [Rhodospirillaceae bacterium]